MESQLSIFKGPLHSSPNNDLLSSCLTVCHRYSYFMFLSFIQLFYLKLDFFCIGFNAF